MNLNIFTDGGCIGNPGIGGWAFAVVEGDEVIYSANGNEKETTNNRMELTAVTKALEYCQSVKAEHVTINTDSQYVKNGINDWIRNWKRNGWRTASKQPVKNKEYWVRLDELNASMNVEWKWVKGHAGIDHNELCDALVREAMDKLR